MQLPFTLLEPIVSSPRLDDITILTNISELSVLDSIWKDSSGEVTALDLETDGIDRTEGGRIVGVGLSDSRGSIYIDLLSSHPSTLDYLMNGLRQSGLPLLAHNLFFEMQWLYEYCLNWKACTYATYRHLANEGWEGQEFGLKAAERDLLRWTETNEVELDIWLVENGFIASYSKEPKAGYYPLDRDKGAQYASPRKSEMWNAPPEILGKYCALDCDATWQLWHNVFIPKLQDFKVLEEWMTEAYVDYIEILVEQKLRGVLIDSEFLRAYREELTTNSLTLRGELLATFREQMDIFNQTIIEEKLAGEPAKFIKHKPLGPEPTKLTKKGEATARWLEWEHRRVIESRPNYMPPLSKNWIVWLQQYIDVLQTDHFNFNSGAQRAWLFYEQLKYPITIRTDKGNPATGEEALLGFGKGGKALLKLIRNDKAISSIDSLLAKVQAGDIYYPDLRVPGTHTGRCAGAGDYNWQNPPKSKYMQAFVARPGYTLISCDIASLENVVLTELSKDKTLWGLYGPEAKPNDGYLYFGSQLPIIGPIIQTAGYDPLNPTKEGIAKAKKEAKKQRDIAKVIVLSSSYGAGAGKIHETLTLSDVDIELEECEAIHAAYWNLCADVKTYEAELKRQWRSNRGWFLNGIGRPIGVDKKYTKDIVNRMVQSTGHDCFILFLLLTFRLGRTKGFKFYPWSADVHDAWYVEIVEEEAEDFMRFVKEEVIPEWNRRLGGLIKLKADPAAIGNLWLDKAEGAALEEARNYAEEQKERIKRQHSDG